MMCSSGSCTGRGGGGGRPEEGPMQEPTTLEGEPEDCNEQDGAGEALGAEGAAEGVESPG